MKAICPNDKSHKLFRVKTYITQEWLVDGHGDFKKCVRNCDVVTHLPDIDDIWVCNKCGAEAKMEE